MCACVCVGCGHWHQLTHTVEEEVGLGRGSQRSRCNYTSLSLWSAARLTSSDYTTSAKETEMAGGGDGSGVHL